jgi:hypothetical protein
MIMLRTETTFNDGFFASNISIEIDVDEVFLSLILFGLEKIEVLAIYSQT